MSDVERAPRAQTAAEQLGPEERASLFARYGRRFSAGETLLREGTPALETLLVHEGRVRLLRRVAMTDRSLAVLRAGDLFGEGALLEGATYGSTAVALSDGALLALDRPTFRSLLGRHPEVAIRVVEQLVRRLRDAEDKIEIMMLRGVQSMVTGTHHKLGWPAERAADGPPAARARRRRDGDHLARGALDARRPRRRRREAHDAAPPRSAVPQHRRRARRDRRTSRRCGVSTRCSGRRTNSRVGPPTRDHDSTARTRLAAVTVAAVCRGTDADQMSTALRARLTWQPLVR